MASCNKEQLIEPEKNAAPIEGNCIVTASTENNLTKTSLEGDDENGYDVVWWRYIHTQWQHFHSYQRRRHSERHISR